MEAAQEAYEKMLPSKNLITATKFEPGYLPSHEFLAGLWEASVKRDEDTPQLVPILIPE